MFSQSRSIACNRTLGLLSLIVLMISATEAEQLTVPTAYDERSPHTINIRVLARELGYATSGKLQIDVHPNGSLYPADQIYHAVKAGEVAMGEVLLASLAENDALFLIDNVPFLVADLDEAKLLWEASKPAITQLLQEDGLRLLYAMPWPPQGLYTENPVTGIADLEGLKLRSYSVMTERMANMVGASTVPVDYSNLRSAFEQGKIDAMITSASTGVRANAWEFSSTYTDIRAWIPKNIVFINEELFQALDPNHRELLLEEAQKAELRGWGIAKEEYFRSRITLSDNGVQVRGPSGEFAAQLAAIGESIAQEWVSEGDARTSEVLNQYRLLAGSN